MPVTEQADLAGRSGPQGCCGLTEVCETCLCNEQVFTGHSGAVTCGQFTPDGRLVVTGGGENDCTLRVWDPKTGSCVHTTQGAHFHSVGELQALCCL